MKFLNRQLATLPWTHLAWGKPLIPKHAFTLWIAIKQKLSTLDRKCTSHIDSVTCVLCNNALESHDHLFYMCPFVKPLWTFIQIPCGFYIQPTNWASLISWAAYHWRGEGSSHSSSFSRLALASLVYNVWAEHNRRIFTGRKLTQNSLLHLTLDSVRAKLLSTSIKDSTTRRQIVEEWNLPSSVLRQPAKPPDI
ncbi:uncharacterized protein LOC132314389 [Cornus florida]|uniref:uncharacterized protein LOC132314389 n=1 Tax=Cornus florida TaxID=4283 RepID=UPI00289F3A00|nr:uncharacterized protein LOC132314389 [Cornus florida]